MKTQTKYPRRILIGLLFSCTAQSASVSPPIDGETGVLHIYGSLTESPCRLEMSSAWQAVSLGNISSAFYSRPGTKARRLLYNFACAIVKQSLPVTGMTVPGAYSGAAASPLFRCASRLLKIQQTHSCWR